MLQPLQGRWRATWDENANWKISYKTSRFHHRKLGESTQGVLWVLQHADQSLTVAQIVERLASEGALLHPWDQAKERDRVQVLLRSLRDKKMVRSVSTPGDRRLRWTALQGETAPDQSTVLAGSRAVQPSLLSDRDWDLIRRSLPPQTRRATGAASARAFIDAVINELSVEGATLLTSGQISRFWSWYDLGVWNAIVERLGYKLTIDDLAALTRKLAALRENPEER